MGITLDPNGQILNQDSQRGFGINDQSSGGDQLTISDDSSTCCVGVIDIVNSTRITSRLSIHKMGEFYSLFINWVAAVIKGYGGRVVKNTGDGLLFYFPVDKNSADLKGIRDCLNCSIALTMLHPNINSKFRSESLPELNYRISLDYGEVSFATTGDGAAPDIFSVTVNICMKINEIAAPNTVIAGGDLYQVSKHLVGYSFHDAKKTLSIANRPYPTYYVAESKTVLPYIHSRMGPQEATELQVLDNVKVEVKRA